MFKVILFGFIVSFGLSSSLALSESKKTSKPPARKPNLQLGKAVCYEFKITGRDDLALVVAQIPEKISGDYFFMNLNAVNPPTGYWVGTFNCYPEKTTKIDKIKNQFSCVGDDDSGRFLLKWDSAKAHLAVRYVHFGNPDEEGPSLLSKDLEKASEAIALTGTKAFCK